MNYEILVSKLQIYGVEDTDPRWFQSYLDNRKQLCKINHQVSNVQRIRCGVPQGSNLGPLFFLLYINDLPNCLETANTSLFADDTNLSCEGKSSPEVKQKLDVDLDNVHNWLMANKLTLNKEKNRVHDSWLSSETTFTHYW